MRASVMIGFVYSSFAFQPPQQPSTPTPTPRIFV